MLADRKCLPGRSKPRVLLITFTIAVINLFLFSPVAYSEGSHEAGGRESSAVKRREAEEIKKILDEALKSDPKDRKATPLTAEEKEEETEKNSLPTTISVLALNLDNGTTPQALFNLVEKLKEAKTENERKEAARDLAKVLKSKVRELYANEDGEIDFERLMKDLTLDELKEILTKKELKEAIEKLLLEPTPIDGEEDEEEQPGDEDDIPPTENENPGDDSNIPGIDDGLLNPGDPNAAFEDFINDDALNPEVIDDELENEDAIDEINDRLDDLQRQAQDIQRDNERNNNIRNNKADGNKSADNDRSNTEGSPQFTAGGGAPSGGGSGGGEGAPKAPEIPKAEPLAPFQFPQPVPESGMDPGIISALLSANKSNDNDRDRDSSRESFSDMLKTYSEMNQQALQSILQAQQAMLSTLGQGRQNRLTPGVSNVQSVGSMANRLQSLGGRRGNGITAPRTSRTPVSGLGNAGQSNISSGVPTSTTPKRYFLRGPKSRSIGRTLRR